MAFKRPRATSNSGSYKRPRETDTTSFQAIKLGTELPPEEGGDEGSFVPVWKQTVTDERGRRRLHGAFTGGFSAGYFNSVGSKEGWTPKTFISSRSNRNNDQPNAGGQKPEDFMDEEDLTEAAESRQLETAHALALVGGSSRSDGSRDDFFGLFMTDEDTMGVKILQRMGWRRDQGVGRKVRRSANLEADAMDTNSKEYSCQHAFAPKDVRSISMEEQDHRKGLGFRKETRVNIAEQAEDRASAFTLSFLEKDKKSTRVNKPAPKKSSFGVGVLNDTGSDDEDPYELGPKINFNKTLGKDKKPKKPSKFSKPSTGDRHLFVPRKVSVTPGLVLVRTTADGRVALKGFVFAAEITFHPSKLKFSPPQIPLEWKSTKGATPRAHAQLFQSATDAAKTSTLDAKARANLLGEGSLPGKSIFDFIPQENRDRIAAATGKTNLPQGLGQSAPEGHKSEGHQDLWSFVPPLDKTTAAAALAKGATGWMPYAEDLTKRARYIAYLELSAGEKNELPQRNHVASVSDWAKELREFAHAAEVFRPASGIMASRFTSSSSSTQFPARHGTDNTLLQKPAAKPEDPAEQAAKLGMHGAMTRRQLPFHPTRLLCKRFNVPPPLDVPPAGDSEVDPYNLKTQEAVSKPDMDRMMREMLTRGPTMQRPAWMNQPTEAATAAATPVPIALEHATVDVENNEALSKERAPDDVFRAIFGDSDDDE